MKEALALARRAVVALEAIAQELHTLHGLDLAQLEHLTRQPDHIVGMGGPLTCWCGHIHPLDAKAELNARHGSKAAI